MTDDFFSIAVSTRHLSRDLNLSQNQATKNTKMGHRSGALEGQREGARVCCK